MDREQKERFHRDLFGTNRAAPLKGRGVCNIKKIFGVLPQLILLFRYRLKYRESDFIDHGPHILQRIGLRTFREIFGNTPNIFLKLHTALPLNCFGTNQSALLIIIQTK